FCFNPSKSLRTQKWTTPKEEGGKIVYDWTVLIDVSENHVITNENAKFLLEKSEFIEKEFVIQQMMGDTKDDQYHSESIMLEIMNTYKGLKDHCEDVKIADEKKEAGFYLFTKFMACSKCTEKLLNEMSKNQWQSSINRPNGVSQQLDPFVAFKKDTKFYVFYSFQWDTDRTLRYGYNQWSTVTWNPKSIQERALERFPIYDVSKKLNINQKEPVKKESLLDLFDSSVQNKEERMILILEKIWFPMCSKYCDTTWDYNCWRKVADKLLNQSYLTFEDVETLVAFKYHLDKEGAEKQAKLESIDAAIKDNVSKNRHRYSVPIGPLIQAGDIYIGQMDLLEYTKTTPWCQNGITIFCKDDFLADRKGFVFNLVKGVINLETKTSDQTKKEPPQTTLQLTEEHPQTTLQRTEEPPKSTSQKTSHHTTTHTTTQRASEKSFAQIVAEATAIKK
ncbi:hypothetical protein CYY_000955, partial [Polysphondylium violaceum]